MVKIVPMILAIGLVLGAAESECGQSKAGGSLLSASADLRPDFQRYGLTPRAQGKRNTCSVFVTTEALEFALAKREGSGKQLSVEYLNWACNQEIKNTTDDRGQFFHDLLKGLDAYGICSDADLSYASAFDPRIVPNETARRNAAQLRGEKFEVHWIKRWEKGSSGLNDAQLLETKAALAKGWPVAAGASHSRLIVAYFDDALLPGRGTFIVADSGSGRYEVVSYEFVKTQANDAFWVTMK